MQNRQLFFSPRKPYDLVADLPCRQAGRSEAASNSLRFSKMWSIIEIVRTVFAAAGGEENPPRNSEIAAPPRR